MAAVVPEDDLPGLPGGGQVDEPLVRRAAEPERDVLEVLLKAAVDEDVEHAEHLFRDFRVAVRALCQQVLVQEAREGPDVLARVLLLHFPQKGHEGSLVRRLEGVAAEERKTLADAAMALKMGVVSQIVETPDGFHIIEVLDKKGDMFNARHILLKPEYTSDDRDKAFKVLDSLKTELNNGDVTFELAAKFYSEDPATRTNGGQMADPMSGSSYFEIDQLKPQDYAAVKDLKVGDISDPVESLDNEGRNGNTVYKIIKVDKVLPAHTASFKNDYTLLLEQAKQKKSMAAIDDFINSKIESTYIIIDPLFKDCDFDKKGWASKFRE